MYVIFRTNHAAMSDRGAKYLFQIHDPHQLFDYIFSYSFRYKPEVNSAWNHASYQSGINFVVTSFEVFRITILAN
jgi:hypothetical protein